MRRLTIEDGYRGADDAEKAIEQAKTCVMARPVLHKLRQLTLIDRQRRRSLCISCHPAGNVIFACRIDGRKFSRNQ